MFWYWLRAVTCSYEEADEKLFNKIRSNSAHVLQPCSQIVQLAFIISIPAVVINCLLTKLRILE